MNTQLIPEAIIQGLQVSKIFKTDTTETLLITLEKDKLFPKHTSPKAAMLVVLEGSINFYIDGKTIVLERNNTYSFQKNVEHHVIANENSKFLIIR